MHERRDAWPTNKHAGQGRRVERDHRAAAEVRLGLTAPQIPLSQVAAYLGTCHTSAVAYHETFWVVTGAEAPVVALAVIVQMTDAFRTIEQDAARPWAQNDRWRTSMNGVLVLGVLNLVLMGWLLFSSLSSLATGTDGLSTGWGTVQAVGGLGLLALASAGVFAVREVSKEEMRRAAQVIGDKDDTPD